MAASTAQERREKISYIFGILFSFRLGCLELIGECIDAVVCDSSYLMVKHLDTLTQSAQSSDLHKKLLQEMSVSNLPPLLLSWRRPPHFARSSSHSPNVVALKDKADSDD